MKVVKVLWIDSCNSNLNWTIAEDIEIEPIYINSFGVVVKDTDEFLAIAQNYGDNPEQYSNITTIPKGCIKKVFVIHEDKMCENDQKSSDKIGSKFHEGEWIIFNENHNSVYQVERIDNYRYYLRHYLGGTLSVPRDSELIRLWKIDDAKDGDVLVGSEGYPFIFSGKYDNIHFGNPIAYCGVTCENKFKESYGTHWTSKNGVTPATKEQCDLLFQKMKEAGYEWDSEKKELKKIEPKTLDPEKVIEWLGTKVYDDSTYGMAIKEQFKKDFEL